MLPMFPGGATLPTDDPQRLRRFYEDVLGFEVRLERPGGIYTLISMDEYRDPHRVRLTPIVP